MSTQNAWLITCGVCCVYPLVAFGFGWWLSRNLARIDWQNINWKFWRRE